MAFQIDYDTDFYIINDKTTIQESKYEIKLLKEENTKLKKDIELLKNVRKDNNFIINITSVDLNKDDMLFEERFENIILYIKLLLSSKYFINNHMIEIDKQYEYLIDTLFQRDSSNSQNYTSTYLKRRNLCISRKIDSFKNLPGPKYYLIECDKFMMKKYTDKNYYQILL